MYFKTSDCGVYCIYNTVNGKRYIGSTTMSFSKRWTAHRCVLRKGKNHCKLFQRAWNKYGESAFEFSILATCAQEHTVEMEQYFIEFFDACNPEKGYNISITAGSTKGFKMPRASVDIIASKIRGQKRTVEQRERMSKAQKSRGHTMTDEAKAALVIRNQKRAGFHISEWQKRRISVAMKGRKFPQISARQKLITNTPEWRSSMNARRDPKTGRILPKNRN